MGCGGLKPFEFGLLRWGGHGELWIGISLDPIESFFCDVIEEGIERVILPHADGVVLMVVALGAGESESEPGGCGGVDAVHDEGELELQPGLLLGVTTHLGDGLLNLLLGHALVGEVQGLAVQHALGLATAEAGGEVHGGGVEQLPGHLLAHHAELAAFDAGRSSSDGGVVVLREVAERTGWLDRFAECFRDGRAAHRVEHPVSVLVKQRVLGLALGYEDLNDHDTLRDDALLALAAGQPDVLGAERARERDRGHALAGKSTLNRLEHGGAQGGARYHRIAHDGAAIERLFVACFLDAHAAPPASIVLDFDATDDPLHGNQEGRFFHGYYGHYCYLPLYVFCGDHLLVAQLREAREQRKHLAVDAPRLDEQAGRCPADVAVRRAERLDERGQETRTGRRDARQRERGAETKRGILPVQRFAQAGIDVAARALSVPDGRQFLFPLDPFQQACLLAGTDELGYLLTQSAAITRFEESRHAR